MKTEQNKKNNNKKQSIFTTTEVPRETHKLIQKLAIDLDINTKQLYAQIVPLGLGEFRKINSISNSD